MIKTDGKPTIAWGSMPKAGTPRCALTPSCWYCRRGLPHTAHSTAHVEVVRETSVCSDGLHDLCSTRLCVNPQEGWHRARYEPCGCSCHAPKADEAPHNHCVA